MEEEGNSEDIGTDQVPKNKQGKPRTRVSRACDRCRSKKDKCDGQKPACSACAAGGYLCNYDPNTKKRGLPEGFVRGMEKLWALAISKVDGLEPAMSEILQDKAQLAQLWNHEIAGEELHERWKSSQVLRSLEELLSGLESGSQSNESIPGSSETLIPTYHNERKFLISRASQHIEGGSEQQMSHDGLHRLSAAADIISTTTNDSLLPPRKRQRMNEPDNGLYNSELLSLPSRTSKILDFYFSYTHCWLPIVERHHVLRTMYSYSGGALKVSAELVGDHAVLWSILALSGQQYMRAVQIANPSGAPVDLDASSIYHTARRLASMDVPNKNISHVQALLLLAVADFGHGRISSSWKLVGQAVRMAIDIGLDKPTEFSRGRNAFVACFNIDTLISARLRRKPHLRTKDVQSVGHIDENGLEEWDPWRDYLGQPDPDQKPAFVLSTYNRLSKILKVLNDIICCSDNQQDSSQQLLNDLRKCVVDSPEIIGWLDSPHILSGQPILPHLALLLNTYKCVETLVYVQQFQYPVSRENLVFAHTQCLRNSFAGIAQILTGYENHRFLFLLPPALEYSLHVAVEASVLVRKSYSPGTSTSSNGIPASWLEVMSRIVGTLQTCWPVYASLQEALNQEIYLTNLASTDSRPQLAQADQSYVGYSSPTAVTTNVYTQNTLQQGWENNRTTLSHFTAPTPLQSSSKSPVLEPSQKEPNGLMAPVDQSMSASPTNPMPIGITMPAGNFEDAASSTYSNSLGIDMTDDLDAIFDDLAQLDTTTWANEREGAFRDFGFNDEMTFRAFCNDPDRMNPSQSATPFTMQPEQLGHSSNNMASTTKQQTGYASGTR